MKMDRSNILIQNALSFLGVLLDDLKEQNTFMFCDFKVIDTFPTP